MRQETLSEPAFACPMIDNLLDVVRAQEKESDELEVRFKERAEESYQLRGAIEDVRTRIEEVREWGREREALWFEAEEELEKTVELLAREKSQHGTTCELLAAALDSLDAHDPEFAAELRASLVSL